MAADAVDPVAKPSPWQPVKTVLGWLEGPRLQFVNLATFFLVVNLTVDFPNPPAHVAVGVGLAAILDGVASRARFGEWRIPWPSMVAALGASMLIDGRDIWTFVMLAGIMVASKHLIRWRGRHLFNPNNVAVAVLILAYAARVGVNDWGAAPQSVALMLLFGTIATVRVKRLDLAVAYLAFSFLAYTMVAAAQGWELATVWAFAFSPLQILIGFFAITDPATSPNGRAEKLIWAALIVLLAVPATLAGRVEAPIFALLIAAPQRHLVTYLVRGTWPRPPAAASAPSRLPRVASEFAPGGDAS